jgi:hypothetical protein
MIKRKKERFFIKKESTFILVSNIDLSRCLIKRIINSTFDSSGFSWNASECIPLKLFLIYTFVDKTRPKQS